MDAYTLPQTSTDDLTKVDVLARAFQRITGHVATHGINATALSMFGLYERMYDSAPGPEAILVQEGGEWAVVAA